MDLVITGPSDDYVKPNQDPSDRPSAHQLMYIDLPKVHTFGNFHVNKKFVWSGVVMPPTLEKLKGHIAFGSSVRASVRASATKFIKMQF